MVGAHESSGRRWGGEDDCGGEREAWSTAVEQECDFTDGGAWKSWEDKRRAKFVPRLKNPVRNGDGEVIGRTRGSIREGSSRNRGDTIFGSRDCVAAVMLLVACSLPCSLQAPENGGAGPLGRLSALTGTRLRLQGGTTASAAWGSYGCTPSVSKTPQVQRLRGGWLCHNLVMNKAQATTVQAQQQQQQQQQHVADQPAVPEAGAPSTANDSDLASLEEQVAKIRSNLAEPGEIVEVSPPPPPPGAIDGDGSGEPDPELVARVGGEIGKSNAEMGRRTTALRQLSQDLEKLESWIDSAVQGYNRISDVLETEEALHHVPTETELYRGKVEDLRARWNLLYQSARRILNTSPNDSTTKLFQGRCRDMLETDAKLSLLELDVAQEKEWTDEARQRLERGMGGVVYQLDAVEFAVGSKVLNSTKDYPVVWVTFVLNCSQTKPGDKLLVVGDSEDLGDWEPVNASRLATSPQMYPLWNCTVPLKRGKMITYKYCIGRPSDAPGVYSGVIWEGHMGNRELRVHRSTKRPMVVEDAFHLLEEHVGNVADNRAPKFVAMHSYGHQDPEYVCFD